MDVLVTLKINDLSGNLLHKVQQVFSDDMGYPLDDFITHYSEHIEEYLLNKIEPDEDDCGEIILRFRYLALIDDNDEGDCDEGGYITEYGDGVTMYDMALTNERVILRFGNIRRDTDEDALDAYQVDG